MIQLKQKYEYNLYCDNWLINWIVLVKSKQIKLPLDVICSCQQSIKKIAHDFKLLIHEININEIMEKQIMSKILL